MTGAAARVCVVNTDPAQAVAALALARHVLPVPHVACFDTAFHAGLPAGRRG